MDLVGLFSFFSPRQRERETERDRETDTESMSKNLVGQTIVQTIVSVQIIKDKNFLKRKLMKSQWHPQLKDM